MVQRVKGATNLMKVADNKSYDNGIGHVLVTCRSNDFTSLEVMLLEVTSLTNDVGYLPVTSSYVTYYYYNYNLK